MSTFSAQKPRSKLIEGLGANKGDDELAKGLSSDFSELIGKATDFSALIENKDKNKKDTILAQLTQDANEFTASLEKLLLKLLIVNPLLNSLLAWATRATASSCRRCFGNNGAPGGRRRRRVPFSGVAKLNGQAAARASQLSVGSLWWHDRAGRCGRCRLGDGRIAKQRYRRRALGRRARRRRRLRHSRLRRRR